MNKNSEKTRFSFFRSAKIWASALFAAVCIGVIAFNFASIGEATLNNENSHGVEGLTLTEGGNKQATWNVSSQTISGTVQGTAGGGCSSASDQSGSLILTNKSGEERTLSFSYAAKPQSGAVTLDGTAISGDASWSKKLGANAFVTISLSSPAKAGAATTISLTGISLIAEKMATITFENAENGAYVVSCSGVDHPIGDEGWSNTASTLTNYTLKATPADGYVLGYWTFETDGVVTRNKDNPVTNIRFGGDTTIRPFFVPSSIAEFSVDGKYFYDLNEAAQYAASSTSKKIVATKNGVLPAGNYTIPAGVRLLVPCDAMNTVHGNSDGVLQKGDYSRSEVTLSKKYVFRNLTLADGVTLTIRGMLSVEGQLVALGGNQNNGMPNNYYGELTLFAGSSVVLESGAKMFAWGYVTGDGEVYAKNGSKVFEAFQIRDFRGGSATSSISFSNKGVFPFCQYFIQNIECEVTLEAGASETCCTAIYALGSITATSLVFISQNETSLFRMEEGSSITKKYNADAGKLEVRINKGTITISNLEVKVYVSINSADYILPINHNMDISVASGATVKVNQSIGFLPNTKLTIDGGANFEIQNKSKVYVYDADDPAWIDAYNYRGLYYPYCATNGYSKTVPTQDKYTDAVIDINGTFTVGAGCAFATTTGGANILSSQGTGSVKFVGGTNGEIASVWQIKSNDPVDYENLSAVCARMKNADGSFTETVGHASDVVFTYASGRWESAGQVATNVEVTFKGPNGSTVKEFTKTAEANKDFDLPTKEDAVAKEWPNVEIYAWQSENTKDIYDLGETLPSGHDFSNDTVFIAVGPGFLSDNNNHTYYFDEAFVGDAVHPGRAKGLWNAMRMNGQGALEQKTYLFDETGLFQYAYTDPFFYNSQVYAHGDDAYYYVAEGILAEHAGLVRTASADITTGKESAAYYYFGSDNKAYASGTYYLSGTSLNGLLCEGSYTFDAQGRIETYDDSATSTGGEITIDQEQGIAHIDGVAVSYGLFKYLDGFYYYADSNGHLVKKKTIYIGEDKLNGLEGMTEGLYYFDDFGHMVNPLEGEKA